MRYLKDITYIFCVITLLASCNDNDTYSSDPSHVLSFGKDSLCLDTIFANTLSPYKMTKVYNNSGDGLRISTIRQEQGAEKSGFMVNVNGSYIDPQQNNMLRDMEIRNGDSIRVFVEVKPQTLLATEDIKKIEDKVVFTYESGTTQTLALKGWVWNANRLSNYHVKKDRDTTLVAGRPLVVYGMLTVDSMARLKIEKGAKIYFHQNGGIKVYGNLRIEGEKDNEVTLRCDRLDSLLQLKYDNVPGKWMGLTFMPSSSWEQNTIEYMDLHGAEHGIIADSTKLVMRHSTVHNVSEQGVQLSHSTVDIENCQLSNACDYCLDILGGDITVNSSTIASFYAYTSGRQKALLFSDKDGNGKLCPLSLKMSNSIVTGYDDDEVWYTPFASDSVAADISIDHSLLRTTDPGEKSVVKMTENYYENLQDDINGEKNFTTFDTYHFYYDFTPKATSAAVGRADKASSPLDDRKGVTRKEKPDAGCYETSENAKQ